MLFCSVRPQKNGKKRIQIKGQYERLRFYSSTIGIGKYGELQCCLDYLRDSTARKDGKATRFSGETADRFGFS